MIRFSILLGAAGLLSTAGTHGQENVDWPRLVSEEVIGGLRRPVDIQHAGDGTGRLYLVEQIGLVRFLENGELTLVLDIRTRVESSGNEQGLLGIAFPQDFSSKRYFYVNYTATEGSGDTRISRFHLAEDSDAADASSEEILLTVDQPFGNHNAGQLQFGPDGYLYVGLGDGGSARDPGQRAQNPGELLGKMLRLDVEGAVGTGEPYLIPPDNPFVGDAGTRDEIWALGLRNPWRYSFDRMTGELYIADVGQNNWEEINVQAADSAGGENYGWDFYEGNHRQASYNPNPPPPEESLTFPVFEYSHSLGVSVTGGYVYRGEQFPRMQGMYFFGDFGSGRIWGLTRDAEGQWRDKVVIDTSFGIASFGEDEAGELYLADLGGEIYRLEDTRDATFGEFSNVGFTEEGVFEFTYGLDSRTPYRVEASTDINEWEELEVVAPGSRSVTVADPSAGAESAKFYRVVPAVN